jgi:putative flippase GtrA
VVLENVVTAPSPVTAEPPRGQRFHTLMANIVRRLPFGLSRIVPADFVGFAIINGFTFSVDLGLLAVGHSLLRWPYPAAVTVSYLTAFALSFVLNRAFNFESHGALGAQTTRYAAAIAINYAAFVLGVGSGLTSLGVEYQLARVLSGLCEGVYMYAVMRWVVFRDSAVLEADLPRPREPVDQLSDR